MPPKDISRKHFRQFSLHCMTGFEPQIFQQRNADALQWLSVHCSALQCQCATVHFSDWSFQTGATMCIATKSLGKGEGGQIFMNQWWCQLPMFAFHVKGSERKRNSGFNAKFKSYGQTGKIMNLWQTWVSEVKNWSNMLRWMITDLCGNSKCEILRERRRCWESDL